MQKSFLSNLSEVVIYTDGGCCTRTKYGGWGALLLYGKAECKISGAEADTTNNRMEILACIESLQRLTRPCNVTIITDSKYVMNGFAKWMPRWKETGWLTRKKEPVKNADLWQKLDEVAQEHNVHWEWVKGHSGVRGNEIADYLAYQARAELEAEHKKAEKQKTLQDK